MTQHSDSKDKDKKDSSELEFSFSDDKPSCPEPEPEESSSLDIDISGLSFDESIETEETAETSETASKGPTPAAPSSLSFDKAAENTQAQQSSAPKPPTKDTSATQQEAPPPPPPSAEQETEGPLEITFAEQADTRLRDSQLRLIGLIVLAVLAALLLVWTYNTKPEPERTHLSQEKIQELLRKQRALRAKQEETSSEDSSRESREAKLPSLWEATGTEDRFSFKLEIMTFGKNLTGIILDMETPEPPKLTPMEFAQGKKEEPWLRNASVKISKNSIEITPSAQSEAGLTNFRAKATARMYVSHAGKRSRKLGDALISGTFDPEDKILNGTWKISLGDTVGIEDKSAHLSLSSKDVFQGLYQSPFTAKFSKVLIPPKPKITSTPIFEDKEKSDKKNSRKRGKKKKKKK